MGTYTIRAEPIASSPDGMQYKFENTKFAVGAWIHIAAVYEYNSEKAIRTELYVNGLKQQITSWTRENSSIDQNGTFTTDPGFRPMKNYFIKSSQVLSVGGSAHGRAGIDGVLDNFQVWDKALTEDDVKLSMSAEFNATNLPDGVLAFWDFEELAEGDGTFKSVGQVAGISAGMHDYEASGGEGQGVFGWLLPEYTSGCPFVTGTAYPVTTLPSWRANRAVLSNEQGNDQAGSATVSYKKDGDYTVTLTLANSLGSDSRTFQVITVGAGTTSVEGVDAAEVATYTVEGAAVVEFAQEGTYTVSVYNMAGVAVASETESVAAGAAMQIALGAKGAYVVVVEKDGEVVRTVKLLNK